MCQRRLSEVDLFSFHSVILASDAASTGFGGAGSRRGRTTTSSS
jgi:hypothetical protein